MSDPGVGTNTKIAKVAAGIFSVVVVVGAVIIIPKIMSAFEGPKVELVQGSIVETLSEGEGDGCIWTVKFAVFSPNRPSGQIWVLDADVDVPPGVRPLQSNHIDGRIFDDYAGELSYTVNPCPASAQEFEHGELEVTYRMKNQRAPRSATMTW